MANTPKQRRTVRRPANRRPASLPGLFIGLCIAVVVAVAVVIGYSSRPIKRVPPEQAQDTSATPSASKGDRLSGAPQPASPKEVTKQEDRDVGKAVTTSAVARISNGHFYRESPLLTTSGTFSISTTMKWCPEAKVYYQTPIRPDHTSSPEINDVVMIAPYPDEVNPTNSIEAQLLVQRYGFTIVGVTFPHMWGESCTQEDENNTTIFLTAGQVKRLLPPIKLLRVNLD